jgi:hypothetical protein
MNKTNFNHERLYSKQEDIFLQHVLNTNARKILMTLVYFKYTKNNFCIKNLDFIHLYIGFVYSKSHSYILMNQTLTAEIEKNLAVFKAKKMLKIQFSIEKIIYLSWFSNKMTGSPFPGSNVVANCDSEVNDPE